MTAGDNPAELLEPFGMMQGHGLTSSGTGAQRTPRVPPAKAWPWGTRARRARMTYLSREGKPNAQGCNYPMVPNGGDHRRRYVLAG